MEFTVACLVLIQKDSIATKIFPFHEGKFNLFPSEAMHDYPKKCIQPLMKPNEKIPRNRFFVMLFTLQPS